MRRFLLLTTALFVLIAIGLPGAALYSVLFTQSGLRFLVSHLPARFGRVGIRIEDVSGTIAGGVRAGLVEVDQERVHLEIRGIYTRVLLEPLLWQEIRSPETTVDSVYIQVKRPPSPPPGPPHVPQFVPRWLTIEIGHASIRSAVLVVPDGTRLTGSAIDGSAVLHHQDIRFRQAQLTMGEVHFADSGSLPSHNAAARRMYSFCTASSSGEGSISNSVDFFSRLRRITSRSGKWAASFRPILSLYLSIWSVAALRLAITPPRRTL